jgi:enoyl-CoA hydratase/carnithine racemase
VVEEKIMNLDTITYDKKENVVWITLNRPEVLNAQNETLLSELSSALEEANKDDEVYVIVLTGAGNKAFSAGGDIREFVNWFPIDHIKKLKGVKRSYELIREIPKPVIAMVNGLALGGGCELAMACDIIIASERARFGQPEINVGVIPGGGGTQMLPRLVGEKKAKELIFTGEFISAEEALRFGLVNRIVPEEKLQEAVEELIRKLKSKSPAILRLAKLSINKSLETPLSVGLASETDFFAMCCGTEDQKEGAKAFLEKRNPRYVGR